MPRLHKYRTRDACYVLTAIKGAVFTYQLTPEGERKLWQTGIAPGQVFPRALLLDLYRSGDAFTRGTGVGEAADAGQLEMDFANDPEPESAFPACAGCQSLQDLNLVLAGTPDQLGARLLCPACRTKAAAVDSSIPLPMLTMPMLRRLFTMKAVAEKDASVGRLEDLLQAEFASRWEALRKQQRPAQGSLFGGREENRLL